MTFVFVSIVGMVISTLPALQYTVTTIILVDNFNFQDTTTILLKAEDGSVSENPWLNMIETICIAWFTLEYFLR